MTKKNILKKESRIKADRHSELVSESIKNKEYHTVGFRIKCSHALIPHSSGLPDGIAYGSGMTEGGRSMVEMLGVLAVIGVLSVAGIAGYSIAMNQHRANEAINQAVRLAMLASAQRLVNSNTTLSSDDLGSAFTMSEDTDKIVLTLSGVSDNVRSKIQSMSFKNAEITPGNDGAIIFTFNNDLSERSGSSSGNSGGQQQETPVDLCAGYDAQCCNNGDITGTGTCDYNGGSGNGLCNAGTCESNQCYNSDCPSWAPCSNGECQCPSHNGTPATYNTSVGRCCADGEWEYYGVGWETGPDCMM